MSISDYMCYTDEKLIQAAGKFSFFIGPHYVMFLLVFPIWLHKLLRTICTISFFPVKGKELEITTTLCLILCLILR